MENCHIVKWIFLKYVIENIGKELVRKHIKQVYKEIYAVTLVLEFKILELIPHSFRSYRHNS